MLKILTSTKWDKNKETFFLTDKVKRPMLLYGTQQSLQNYTLSKTQHYALQLAAHLTAFNICMTKQPLNTTFETSLITNPIKITTPHKDQHINTEENLTQSITTLSTL